MRVIILGFLLACGTTAKPTPTGAMCPDASNPQYSWQNFGYNFFCHYCDNCHDSELTLNQRNGAPLFHNLDSLTGVMDVANHVDIQAAWGPKAHNDFMPGGGTGYRCPSMLGGPLDEDCPSPTGDERTALGIFLACEAQRPQDYQTEMTDHCASYTGPH